MKMCELFSFLEGVSETDLGVSAQDEVLDLTADTRKIKKGSLFFLLPRAEVKFDEYFKKSGAAVAFVHSVSTHKDQGLYVKDIESVYFRALKVFYKDSCENLKVYGITGTNGKTTTAFMLQTMLELYDVPTGLYGTIENAFRKNFLNTGLTSPPAEDFYRFNHENYQKGMEAVVCEVSSHALDQRRLSTQFLDGAAFTSFSQDHLDYHQTMESYLEAKAKIQTEALKKTGFFVLSKEAAPLKKWGAESLRIGEDFDFEILKRSDEGVEMTFSKGGQCLKGLLPLFGDYNVSNFALALSMLCEHFGSDFFPDDRVFKKFKQIPGRMERVDISSDSSAFIDYSHTPDSLEKALESLGQFSGEGKKIICVFGCGGDRDKGKRPLMGLVAEKLSDFVVVTNDNPRSESPELIAKDIVSKRREPTSIELITELDRAKAIKLALERSLKTPSFVLIAGKGHEKTQEIMGVKKDFSDLQEVLSFKRLGCKT